jgi:hypothetical protein
MRWSDKSVSRLYLTADLLTCEPGAVLPERTLRRSFSSLLHPFPPIDDLVAGLDRVASRRIDA